MSKLFFIKLIKALTWTLFHYQWGYTEHKYEAVRVDGVAASRSQSGPNGIVGMGDLRDCTFD